MSKAQKDLDRVGRGEVALPRRSRRLMRVVMRPAGVFGVRWARGEEAVVMRTKLWWVALVAVVALLGSSCAWIARVSVNDAGEELSAPGDVRSQSAVISGDGRYVAFESLAPNLVAGDTNRLVDVFLRDTVTGATRIVSVNSAGDQGNHHSTYVPPIIDDRPTVNERGRPAVSADGRFVAFASIATNLVPDDTNGWGIYGADVFVHDTLSGTTTRVSVDSAGNEAGGLIPLSSNPAISADGRYVAFESTATNLVEPDANGWEADIFLHDTSTGVTSRVSVDSAGVQGNADSVDPVISADGRYVAFESQAALVAGDTNGVADVFVHDTVTGTTTRVSVDSAGVQGNGPTSAAFDSRPAVSADGRYVAFESSASNLVAGDTNGVADVFVHDTVTGTTSRVSVDSAGNQSVGDPGDFLWPSISADGSRIAFSSAAPDLVAGDTNGVADVFVHDTTTGVTARMSIGGPGAQGTSASRFPSISADGARVSFESQATNLVAGDTNGLQDTFVHDTATTATTRVSVDSAGNQPTVIVPADSSQPSISDDGRFAAFVSAASNIAPADINGVNDVFVRDNTTAAVTAVSVDSAGTIGNGPSQAPSMASDGTRIAFSSSAFNLVAGDTNGVADVFVHDTTTATTTRASLDSSGNEANAASSAPAISADGRHVAFSSSASNLVAGDTNGVADIYRHDTLTGETIRVSVNSSGDEANGASSAAAVSADGRYVAFESDASNLVGGDTNSIADVFVHDTVSGATTRVSVDSAGNQAVASGWSVPLSAAPDISADGRVVTFASTASNLVTGDTNDLPDVFVHDTVSGATTRVSVDSAGNQITCPPLPAPELCEEFQIGSVSPSVSADGRQIAFASSGVGLVPDGASPYDPQVFVHDTSTGTTRWVSLDGLGNQAGGVSSAPALSDDGLYVGFTATASNLVEGDTGRTDVFVRAVTQPVVDTVTPSSFARAATTTVTVTGAGFGPGTSVSTFVTNPNGVTIDSVTVVSTTELELEVTVDPTAATGTRNLFLTVPGPGPGNQGITDSHGTCAACLTVT